MNKSKIMNFRDGPKTIHVGMEVLCTNGQSGPHSQVSISPVESVGSKYSTLKNGMKFYLSTGRQCTQYASGSLYSSREAYEQTVLDSRCLEKVRQYVKSGEFTVEQAKAIAHLLGRFE